MSPEQQRPALLLSLLWVLVACPGSPPVPLHCDALPVADEWVQLGTGEGEFEAFDEDATLRRVFGSQGGIHIWASLEGAGFHPGLGSSSSIPPAAAEFSIVDEANGNIVGEGELDDSLRYLQSGQILAPGNRTILEQWTYDSIYGEESDFCDEFSDDDDDDGEGDLCGQALEDYLESRRYIFSASLTDGCGNQASDSRPVYIDF